MYYAYKNMLVLVY